MLEANNCAFIEDFDNLSFVNRILSEDSFEVVPWVLLNLLVTKAEATVLLVDIEYLYFDFCTNLCEL